MTTISKYRLVNNDLLLLDKPGFSSFELLAELSEVTSTKDRLIFI